MSTDEDHFIGGVKQSKKDVLKGFPKRTRAKLLRIKSVKYQRKKREFTAIITLLLLVSGLLLTFLYTVF
ncbi:MAG: hypothetical protein R3277_01485 [Brumimicrobium sp.]|nr:hypothetical protein [Brumimicrobium sp.]